MTATIRPAVDPYHIKDEPKSVVGRFRTEMFRISYNDLTGDKDRYEKFMKTLYPYDQESNLELHIQLGNPITKTWTKEGDLLIHVEYIELESPKKSDQNDPDTKKW